MKVIFSLAMLILTQGCVANLVKDVVTAPVKIASKSVDLLTTSRSEADEKRGREMRESDERLGKSDRERAKLSKKCDKGNRDACRDIKKLRT